MGFIDCRDPASFSGRLSGPFVFACNGVTSAGNFPGAAGTFAADGSVGITSGIRGTIDGGGAAGRVRRRCAHVRDFLRCPSSTCGPSVLIENDPAVLNRFGPALKRFEVSPTGIRVMRLPPEAAAAGGAKPVSLGTRHVRRHRRWSGDPVDGAVMGAGTLPFRWAARVVRLAPAATSSGMGGSFSSVGGA